MGSGTTFACLHEFAVVQHKPVLQLKGVRAQEVHLRLRELSGVVLSMNLRDVVIVDDANVAKAVHLMVGVVVVRGSDGVGGEDAAADVGVVVLGGEARDTLACGVEKIGCAI